MAAIAQDSPLPLKPLDAGQMELAKVWLSRCTGNVQAHEEDDHSFCNLTRSAGTFLPTRLLDVNIPDQSTEIRLVETINLKTKPGQDDSFGATTMSNLSYLTLSHRWSLTGIVKTTVGNQKGHMSGLDIGILSPTFKEGVRITRELGFRYLWIDSLCIIQDDTKDWERESANMDQIYMYAVMNIADATPPPENEADGVRLSYFLPNSTWIEPYAGQLQNRGWVLQERLCAAATLFLGLPELIWACRGAYMKEGAPKYNHQVYTSVVFSGTIPIPRFLAEVVHNGTSGMAGFFEGPVVFWMMLVDDYSCRQLTRETDRLPALAGLSKRFQAALPNWDYSAGLWLSKDDPDSCLALLWKVAEGFELKRPKSYLAPSWSWASILSPVRSFKPEDLVSYITLTEACLFPASENTFGQLDPTKRGYLKVQTKLIPAQLEYESWQTASTNFELKSSYFRDHTDSHGANLDRTYRKDERIAPVWVMIVAADHPVTDGRFVYGLVLQEEAISTQQQFPNSFHRIGSSMWYLGSIEGEDVNWDPPIDEPKDIVIF